MRIWLVHSRTKGCDTDSYPASIHWTRAGADKAASRGILERNSFIEWSQAYEGCSPLPIHYFIRPATLRFWP